MQIMTTIEPGPNHLKKTEPNTNIDQLIVIKKTGQGIRGYH